MTGAGGGAWSVERARASARALHEAWPSSPARAGRTVRLCAVAGTPALVLGSAQDEDVVDGPALARAGLEVLRRGAGGGAVVVSPGAQVWADLWLPRADPLWSDDVVASSSWVGELWSAALSALGVAHLAVHHGPSTTAPWSERVCFAGLGPGEVTVEGRKVVGVAQRRTRAGARWYTMAPLVWEPALLLSVLGSPAPSESPAAGAGPDDDAALAQAALGLRSVVPDAADMTDEELIAAAEEAVIGALAP